MATRKRAHSSFLLKRNKVKYASFHMSNIKKCANLYQTVAEKRDRKDMGDSKERKAAVKLNLNLSQFIAKLNSDLYIFAIG